MPDDARRRYLAELDRALPFPTERRAEIIEEISAHLDDAVTHRLGRGVPNDRAEALSQAELGAPADLARNLARIDQASWRLLAAVGAGVRAGVGPGLYGFVLATVLAFVVTMAVLAVLQAGAHVLGSQWTLANTDQGWNTVMLAAAAALGLSYAGESAVRAVSVTSHRGGATLTGTVVTTGEPGISHWTLILTGVGADGTRYVVADGGGGNSTFTGSAWDWLVAVTRD